MRYFFLLLILTVGGYSYSQTVKEDSTLLPRLSLHGLKWDSNLLMNLKLEADLQKLQYEPFMYKNPDEDLLAIAKKNLNFREMLSIIQKEESPLIQSMRKYLGLSQTVAAFILLIIRLAKYH